MKKYITTILLAATLAYAGPAFNGTQSFKNADNSTFQGKLHGSPWMSYVQDNSGNIVVFDQTSGDFQYADFDSTNKKLVASGIKAGTLGATRATNPTLAQIQIARAAAQAALAQPALIALLHNSRWYEVRDYGTGDKTAYQIDIIQTSSMELSRIMPDSTAPVKTNQTHIDGGKLVNDSVQHLVYYTFDPKSGYIEVKVHEDINSNGTATLKYTDRWYSTQADAIAYYNTL